MLLVLNRGGLVGLQRYCRYYKLVQACHSYLYIPLLFPIRLSKITCYPKRSIDALSRITYHVSHITMVLNGSSEYNL